MLNCKDFNMTKVFVLNVLNLTILLDVIIQEKSLLYIEQMFIFKVLNVTFSTLKYLLYNKFKKI